MAAEYGRKTRNGSKVMGGMKYETEFLLKGMGLCAEREPYDSMNSKCEAKDNILISGQTGKIDKRQRIIIFNYYIIMI